MLGDGFKGLNQKAALKTHDVVVTLHCTLEEFYVGSIKKFEYMVDEVQHDGNTVLKVKKNSSVQVDPGFSEQTVLTFKGKGNQFPKLANSNLVIKFAQVENKHFRRNGDDLILTLSVSFVDCLNFKPVTVRTLDGRSLTQCFDELVSPQTVRVIKGEGMPLSKPVSDPETQPFALLSLRDKPKGDLYLRFDIHFPKQLTNANRLAIIQTLKANEEEQQ